MRWRLVFVVVVSAAAWGATLSGCQSTQLGHEGFSRHGLVRAERSSQSSTPSKTAGPSTPTGIGSNWRLIFNPSFPGSRLNTSVWASCYLWANAARGCTNFGNSDEYEWYLPSQDRVSGGILHLVAQRIPTQGQTRNGEPKKYFCRSGMVTTYPSLRFKYGYLQVVARIPLAPGLWSALWLASAEQHWPPEIDILEHWGPSPADTNVYFHPVRAARLGSRPSTANLSVGWHIFALSWTASSLTWFIDGREVMSTNENIPHEAMYFIADLADYVRPEPGKGCNGTLLIRSVKVWQP